MKVGTMMHQSFVDHHGKILGAVFLSGCNFQCSHCQNEKIAFYPDNGTEMTPERVYNELVDDNFLIDGVLVSGGEPCIQDDVPEFIRIVRERRPAFFIVLNTNGTNPDMVEELLPLVDKVAIDVKSGDPDIIPQDVLDRIGRSLSMLRWQDEIRFVLMDKTYPKGDEHFTILCNYIARYNRKTPLVIVPYKYYPNGGGAASWQPGAIQKQMVLDFVTKNFGFEDVRIR